MSDIQVLTREKCMRFNCQGGEVWEDGADSPRDCDNCDGTGVLEEWTPLTDFLALIEIRAERVTS